MVVGRLKIFLIHVRYWGAFVILTIGAALTLPGELLIELGKWIGSRSDK